MNGTLDHDPNDSRTNEGEEQSGVSEDGSRKERTEGVDDGAVRQTPNPNSTHGWGENFIQIGVLGEKHWLPMDEKRSPFGSFGT